jgi:hypothetical protein
MSSNYTLSENGTVIEYHLIVKTMKKNEDYKFYSERERDKAFKKALEEKNLLLAHCYTRDSEQIPEQI